MKYLPLIFLVGFLGGCTIKKVPQQTFKSKIIEDLVDSNTSQEQLITYKPPYVSQSKYVKILILPFPNSEGDLDYGGVIETKIEDSKFIFNNQVKNRLEKRNTIIGGVN